MSTTRILLPSPFILANSTVALIVSLSMCVWAVYGGNARELPVAACVAHLRFSPSRRWGKFRATGEKHPDIISIIAKFGAAHYPHRPQSRHTIHVIGQGAGFANR